MALTDAAGDVDTTWDYDVFGAVRNLTGSQPNDFTFAGEQADGSTGLQYLRARYYDPEVGRLLSKDPSAWDTTVDGHAFAYAKASPTGYVDPLGLDPIEDVYPIPVNGTPQPTSCDCGTPTPGDTPIPLPAPAIGSHDDSNCYSGLSICRDRNSWFGREMTSKYSNVRRSLILDDCDYEFLRCVNRATGEGEAYFDFDEVRRAVKAQSQGWRFPIVFDPPDTGTGGLVPRTGNSKEGNFDICR